MFKSHSTVDQFLKLRDRVLNIICRVPTVRESRGILKYHSLDQLFMHYFHNFCRLLGPKAPLGLCPKHCRLVYIAIFYNGTKFSITFVYLVLFCWCRE